MANLIRKPDPTEAWAIAHWRGGFYPNTVSELRRDAVSIFKEMYGVSDKDWRDDVKYGVHNAVKITIALSNGVAKK